MDSDGQVLAIERDFKGTLDLAGRLFKLAVQADAAIIEQVGAMPGQGVVSMFTFGEAYGAAQGAVAAAGLTPAYKVPQVWQNFIRERLNCPRPQEFDSVELVRQIYGQGVAFLARKKDHNTADAVLLGWYYLWAGDVVPGKPAKKKRRPIRGGRS